jgi:hypothetical protein
MKFQVDTSNTFRDMLRTKMSYGRTDGRTKTISKSSAAFSAGDKKWLYQFTGKLRAEFYEKFNI